jgi:lipoprotein-anchoring transpeptidase ErfK/SrfK
MKFVSVAIFSAAMIMSCPAAFATPQLTKAAIDRATFEEWRVRRETAPAVLEVDSQTGEVKAPEPGTSGEADAAEIPIPGQPNAVIETPHESTDVPDEARAQIAADADVLEEAEKEAEAALDKSDPFLVRLQVLLDRVHVSPGVIDGLLGGNTRKAMAAYEQIRGLPVDGEPDAEVWAMLTAEDTKDATQIYELTGEDIDSRYIGTIPNEYAERAKIEWLGYRDVTEMLAEKFHMDVDLLRRMNPTTDFTAVGSKIIVPVTGPAPTGTVARVLIDKSDSQLLAYDDSDNIVLVGPATIGSTATPHPSGKLTVAATASAPTYFLSGKDKELTIPPGPNGPVGTMWIDLSKPTCGIHGTAAPETVGQSQRHGCVGLTNWDVKELSALVQPGKTVVEFQD